MIEDSVVSEEVVSESDVLDIIPNEWIVEDVDLNENQQEIFDEFILLKDDDWIEYETENYNLSEDDLELIFNRIKKDIFLNKINEDDDFEDIILEYFEQFYLDCNSHAMINYYENIVNSSFYTELIGYYNLDDENVEDINNKIKADIQSKDLDKQDIINRFKIYFENKFLELEYKSKLENIDKNKYINEYNLYESEINDIINKVISLIENWYEDLSIFNKSCESIFNKCLNDEIDLIRSVTRKEFEKRYESKEIIINILRMQGIQKITDENYDRLIEDIYWDIKGLIIRQEDINDDLLKEYF